jgi:hypothetical protein
VLVQSAAPQGAVTWAQAAVQQWPLLLSLTPQSAEVHSALPAHGAPAAFPPPVVPPDELPPVVEPPLELVLLPVVPPLEEHPGPKLAPKVQRQAKPASTIQFVRMVDLRDATPADPSRQRAHPDRRAKVLSSKLEVENVEGFSHPDVASLKAFQASGASTE